MCQTDEENGRKIAPAVLSPLGLKPGQPNNLGRGICWAHGHGQVQLRIGAVEEGGLCFLLLFLLLPLCPALWLAAAGWHQRHKLTARAELRKGGVRRARFLSWPHPGAASRVAPATLPREAPD